MGLGRKQTNRKGSNSCSMMDRPTLSRSMRFLKSDRLPAKSDEGRGDLACVVYIGRESNPVEALAFSAGYRRVPKIPWLKPLKRRMR